jgi:hypothetical protein
MVKEDMATIIPRQPFGRQDGSFARDVAAARGLAYD